MQTVAAAFGFTSPAELLAAAFGFVMVSVIWPLLRGWLQAHGIEVNDKRSAVIEKALRGGTGFVAELALQRGYDVRNPGDRIKMATAMADYVKRNVPETLAAMDLSAEQLSDLVWSRLPTPDGHLSGPLTSSAIPAALPVVSAPVVETSLPVVAK